MGPRAEPKENLESQSTARPEREGGVSVAVPADSMVRRILAGEQRDAAQVAQPLRRQRLLHNLEPFSGNASNQPSDVLNAAGAVLSPLHCSSACGAPSF